MIETRKSFCRFCACCCGIEVDIDSEQSRVVAIRGDSVNPHSRGYTCPRGRAAMEELHHPERILTPKKRVGNKWMDISYPQALDEIADKTQTILNRCGPRSVARFKGMFPTWNISALVVSNAWMSAMGSYSLFSDITTCRPGSFLAAQRFFGHWQTPLGWGGGALDMSKTEVLMLIGTNPLISYDPSVMPCPASSKYIRDARKKGTKLIVVDPRRSETAKLSDLHLQVRPGEDAALLAAMIKIIIERKLYDQDYVAKYVSGFDILQSAVSDFDLEYVTRRTGVTAEQIAEAASVFAKAKSGAARFGVGLTQSRHSSLTLYLVHVLNALCGRIDRPGGLMANPGVFTPPMAEDHVPVTEHMFAEDRPSRFRGLASLKIAPGYTELPASVFPDEVLEPGEGQIRALFVMGCNPVLSVQDQVKTVRAMKDLELLVAVDPFMTATSKLAHYVLPTKHFLERPEYTNGYDPIFEMPYGQYTPAILDRPDIPEDWEVIWDLAQRMNVPLNLPGLPDDRKPSTDELMEWMLAGSRVPLEKIRKNPSGIADGELTVGRTVPGGIAHPDRKMAAGDPQFMKELREVRAEPVTGHGGYCETRKFSHRMVQARLPGLFGTRGTKMESLKKKYGTNPAVLNPKDAEFLGVADGDLITIDSGYGRIKAVVATSDIIMTGTVEIGFGWGVAPEDEVDVREQGCSPNRLVPNDELFEPFTGIALQTALPVNLYWEQAGKRQ